jgi:uroporphyrinogen decarboxylase
MNARERVLLALDRKEPDRVPIFESYINDAVLVELARLLGVETKKVEVGKERSGEEKTDTLDLYCGVVNALDLDMTSTKMSTGLKRTSPERGRDMFGTIWLMSPHGEPFPIEGPIKGLKDLEGFDMASRLTRDDFARIRYVIEKVGKEKAHFVTVSDPFKINWNLRGSMENLLMDYIDNPELVHGLARMATIYDKKAIDLAVEAGADVIFSNGDLAGELTLLMSPTHYREYVKPYQKEIVAHAHQKGVRIVKHSDGNMWPILDDLMEVGYDGFHPVQPQCMKIADVKKHVAGRICLVGNIDCRELLPFGTVEEVKRTVKETIEAAAPGGGYIISSSNTIHPACKAENYLAMVEAAHQYGRYA